ncbi:MAG: hypothetical protein IKC19_05195 [Bacteroidales bacterium]|nr:hypothetical protein [Bacteroidales bacterium]
MKSKRGHALWIETEGLSLAATDTAVVRSETYSVTSLYDDELPPLPQGMTNMTACAAGYRLLPGGEHFYPYAKLSVKYDPSRLPFGYTAEDIYTSYYDTVSAMWVRLERVAIDTVEHEIVSLTSHFTDFINELLKAPEMPETQAFVPTSISGLEAANPMAGYTTVAPPEANNMGTANITYPIHVPAGRQGVEPHPQLVYNSNGGNSVCGVGWDLPVQCISVETRWGVPLYDSVKETETYLLNGEQLLTSYDQKPAFARPYDNRTNGDVRFYPRVEGAFDSIIRHGTRPENYWWEVFDRNGTQYIYGDNNESRLRSQRARGVAKWYISKIIDRNGNTIQYKYFTYRRKEGGRNSGIRVYLDRILYTLPNGGSVDSSWYGYCVSFYYGSGRPDPVITGNYGVKENTCLLLDSVKTWYVRQTMCNGLTIDSILAHTQNTYILGLYKDFLSGMISETELYLQAGDALGIPSWLQQTDSSLIRGYRFLYSTSLTGKSRLDAAVEMSPSEWTHYAENVSTSDFNTPRCTLKYHRFNYQDSVDTVFGKHTTLATEIAGANNIFSHVYASPLGSSRNWNTGVNVGVGLGLGYETWFRTQNIEATANITPYTVSNGKSSLIDINGDGYPDLLYSSGVGNSTWYYQLFDPQNNQYNARRTYDLPTSGFSRSKSNGISVGLGINAGMEFDTSSAVATAGVNVAGQTNRTESQNTMYFADVNADGLPDIVKNGTVWFNNSHGNTISFDESYQYNPIADTPCEMGYYSLEGASALDASVFDTGNASITFVSSINDQPYDKDSLYVISNIKYDTLPSKNYDTVRRSAVRVWIAPFRGTVSISGSAALDERFDIARANTGGDGVHVSIQHNGIKLVGYDLVNSTPRSMNRQNVHVNKGDRIYFRVESLMDDKYDVVEWNPVISYAEASPTTVDCEGRNKYIFDASRDFLPWQEERFYMPYPGRVDINADYTFTSAMCDTVWLHIICADSLDSSEYWHDSCTILPGTAPTNAHFSITDTHIYDKASIRFEAYSRSRVDWTKLRWFPHIISKGFDDPAIPASSTVLDEDMNQQTVYSIDCHPSPIFPQEHYTLPDYMDLEVFKSLHRGWGVFVYNDSRMRTPIKESRIKLDTRYDGQYVDSLVDDPSAIIGDTNTAVEPSAMQAGMNNDIPNPDNTAVSKMNVVFDEYSKSRIWTAFAYRSFISANTTSMLNWQTTRTMLAHDELLHPTTNHSIAESGITNVGPNKESVQTGWGVHASIGAGIRIDSGDTVFSNLSPSACFNRSHGSHSLTSDFMDFNGDGFPDVIGENEVQYSRSTGGLSEFKAGSVPGSERGIQKTIFDAYSLQGGAAFAAYNRIFKESASVSIHERVRGTNINSDAPVCALSDDSLALSWMDVNGDGLPDFVNGTSVAINLGYDYYDMETLNGNPMPQNKSTNRPLRNSASYSYSKNTINPDFANTIHNTVNRSFSVGLGTNESDNASVVLYADINGDGLVDKIIGNQSVYFNTGWGFDGIPHALGYETKNHSKNHNVDLNGNFTYGCPVTFFLGATVKFQLSAGVAIGNSASTTEATLMDMNADGLPDLVMRTGFSGDNIDVYYNQMYSVDKLVSINSFYGNSIEIGYAQAGYSPMSRQRPTVMETLSVSDITGACNDVRKFTFSYSGYVHSVNERTPYGFSNVVVTQLMDNSPYRITKQRYRTDIYKMRGKKEWETVEDAQGHLYVEHKWEYELKQISDGEIVPIDMQHCFDATWPALNIARVLYFDPSNNGVKIETAEQYNHDGYGLVKQYINRNNIHTTDDDLFCRVQYTRCNRNQSALPQEIYVFDDSDNLLQYREARYYPNGLLESLILHNNSSASVTDYRYDPYGNVVHVTLPENDGGERPGYRYDYDNLVHQFRISATDTIWGDESRTDYDIRLGVPLRVFSVGGDSISYTYDDWGRPLTIRAPQEADTTVCPTIRYAYWDGSIPSPQLVLPHFHSFTGRPAAFGLLTPVTCQSYAGGPVWAQTIHRSRADANLSVETVLFADGHARVLQTRKTAVVNDIVTQVASGHTVYDDAGRAVRMYEPFVSGIPFCQYATPTDTGMVTQANYDILDRTVSVVIPAVGSTTTNVYDFASISGVNHFMTRTTDPGNNTSTTVSDARGLTLQSTDALGNMTLFAYSAAGLLQKSTDPDGFVTEYQYDMLGQMVSRNHPDAGLTEFLYDPAGHVIEESNMLGKIFYDYTYYRPRYKRYSYMPGNNVTYDYGVSGRNRGRLTQIVDGTGERWLDYDALGNVAYENRIVTIPDDYMTYYFGNSYSYDSWGRMLSMTYPDGEMVSYRYNAAGDLYGMDWTKGSQSGCFIGKIHYNKYGNRTYMEYGNHTATHYTYDRLQRLNHLQSTDRNNNKMQDISYTLDRVGNIAYMENLASSIGSLGGLYQHKYGYDNIYRLVDADGNGSCGNWNNRMEYTDGGRIGWKQTFANSAINNATAILNYGYCDTYQPHAPRRIKDTENQRLYDLQWDRAGNLGQCNTAKDDGSWLGSRHLFWTIDNRMHAAVDADNYSYYTYDYTGERTLKLTGRNSEMDVNAELQHTSAALDRPTLYPSPYLVMGMHGYTKHYYAGTERICAKTGGGFGESISKSFPDLQAAADSLFSQSRENIRCRELLQNVMECVVSYGHVPDAEMNVHLEGMPSHFRADAEIYLGEFHRVVEWCEHGSEEEDKVFFYHSDHLGSASWITDAHGDAVQHLQYLPFGEPFVDQRISGYSERFRFTGKERDEETGFGYFGARYMDHELMTMWLSVDRYADKYPFISPYAYCAWNPIKMIDPTGDTITLSPESWAIQKEAFLSVFDRDEKKIPFSYDNETKRMSYTGENGDYGFSDTQKEVIEHYRTLCEKDYNVSVQVVNNDEFIETSKGRTTLEKEFAMGMTVPTGEKSANVYISKFPLYLFNGKVARRPLRDVYQSIAIIHEIGGHAYYNSQEKYGAENNELTRVFENACRDIFTASYSRGTNEIRKGRASYEH